MWADDENIDEADGTFARIGRLAFGLLVLIAFAGVVWTAFKDAPLNQRHAIRSVTRVELPPPIPSPPKPAEREKNLEQPREQSLAETPPEQQPPMPPRPLSQLTAPAGSGPNPYGLQAGSGTGDVVGTQRSAEPVALANLGFAAYGHVVAAHVQEALSHDDKLRYGHFLVELRMWLDRSGRVTRIQLMTSSGDAATDSAVTRTLSGLSLGEPPPDAMPQPIRLRARAEPN